MEAAVLCQSLKLGFTDLKLGFTVIPAQAGIQIAALDSRLRGNDVTQKRRFDKALGIHSGSNTFQNFRKLHQHFSVLCEFRKLRFGKFQ
jgi:hypothetical protein